MTKTDFPALEYLLSGYFHQDWPEQFAGDTEALNFIVENERSEIIAGACTDIDALLAVGLTETELDEFMYSKLGCSFNPEPRGLSNAEWLRSVKRRLQTPT